MTDTHVAQQAPPSELPPTPPAPPPLSPAQQLQNAVAALNHPANLAVPDRLHAIQNAINVMAAQLLPLLPTE